MRTLFFYPSRNFFHTLILVGTAFFWAWAAQAQTTLIDPLGAGGFESGATFTANGWSTTVTGTNNNWNLGTAAPGFSGTRAAYISVDGGTSFLADNTGGIVHVYRNISFPALESKITLTFRLHILNADPGWDRLRIWSMPAANTPSAGSAIAASVDNIQHGLANYEAGTGGTFVTQATVSLPTSFAGTSRKIIFEYINDAFNPGAAIGIDDINLISSIPSNITSTPIGGLWSSPATWVGGVVPNADNVTIVNGATVTVDQVTSVNNLTINGNLNWNGTANAMTTSGNVLVGVTGRLNQHTVAATPGQITLNCGGDFTNNGFANMSVAGLIMNRASGTQAINGTGTFLSDPSGRGIIKVLQFATLATVTISTTQTLVTQFPAHTGAVLNTGNKLEIDNTAIPTGTLFNEGVYTISVTNMGSGYNTATPPTITIASPPAGVTATATPNIDNVTGTLRSITITSNGNGYRTTAPTVTIAGGTGTGATALACVWSPTANWGIANSTLQKSAVATISGTMPINSSQGVGSVFATTRGTGYTSAPAVGFSLPTGVWNLVTAQGSGYTAAVTVVFTGGGGTGAAGTATVANGRVTRIQITSGGSNYTSLPTISFTGGGGGTGAAAAFPPGCLATATASINNGMVSGFTITNAGSGYLPAAAPAVTLTGGGFTVPASGLTSRIGAYNLTYGFFAPSKVNFMGTEGPEIPTNRRINSLTMNSTAGNTFTGNLTLYAAAPATFTAGPWYFGGNTLTFENPTYAGAAPAGTNGIASGNITMNSLGASVTRTFPFNPSFVMVMGTGTLAAGSDITRVTVSRTGAPSGAVLPSGTPTGLRTYTANVVSGTAFGATPSITLNWNAGDNLAGNQPGLVVMQSTTGITGGWNVRSTGSGLGAIPTTGSRASATVAPGPIVFGSNMYFGFGTTTALPPALAYNVTRSTGIAYSSIFGSGNNYTFGTINTDDALSNSVDLTTIPGGPTTFTYQGAVITAAKASTNGFVSLNGTETSNGVTNNFTGLAGTAVAAFWDDLVCVPNNTTAASLNAAMQWQVIGAVPGSRQIVFEWRNMSFFGATGPNMAFQIILNETGNTIQVNYGLFQGFNGTNNHRPTYTVGLRGSFCSANPQPGEVFAQEYENFNLFSNAFTAGANQGSNGLLNYPECNSRLSFTPGAYVPPAAPSITPPANDNAGGAFTLAPLLSFPTNLCGYYYTSRGATASPQAVCSGNANDDVWFKFTPDPDPVNPPNAFQYIVKLYASGGYTPTFEVLDNTLNPLGTPVCVSGSAGGSPQATITGLTPGLEYFIRVYHNEGPSSTTALLSAVVSGGSVVSSFVTGGVFGAGYSSTSTGSFNGSRARITGGGGQGAVIGLNYAAGGISTFNIGSGGYGYTSTPTITVESPAWGPMGDFGIVIFQYLTLLANNLPAAATTLSVQTGSCSSSLTGQYTVNSIDIPGPVLANTCGGVGNGNPDDDLWYRFLANSNNATVQMQGVNNFSPVFQVYTGTANILDVDPTVFTHLTCSNNPGVNGLATASFTTTPGTYYWVRAYSPATGNTDPLATFNICVFNVTPQAGQPVISPGTGTYTTSQTVTISSPTPGASIYYTLSGNIPVIGTSFTLLYSGPILISSTKTIRAMAVAPGFQNSAVSVANLTINNQVVGTPTITPGTGTYTGLQNVSIVSATTGATIYYTTNGNVPSTSVNSFTKLYTAPFQVNATTTIRAIAVKSGIENSAVAVAFLTINSSTPVAATPVINPGTGTYLAPQTISITSSTPGSTIYYTTSGNIPVIGTSFTKLYIGSFQVNSTTTVRAMAIAPGFINSAIAAAFITISSQLPALGYQEREVEFANQNRIRVYPNPGKGVIIIESPDEEILMAEVIGVDGKILEIGFPGPGIRTMKWNSFGFSGFYTIKLQTASGVFAKKLILQ